MQKIASTNMVMTNLRIGWPQQFSPPVDWVSSALSGRPCTQCQLISGRSSFLCRTPRPTPPGPAQTYAASTRDGPDTKASREQHVLGERPIYSRTAMPPPRRRRRAAGQRVRAHVWTPPRCTQQRTRPTSAAGSVWRCTAARRSCQLSAVSAAAVAQGGTRDGPRCWPGPQGARVVIRASSDGLAHQDRPVGVDNLGDALGSAARARPGAVVIVVHQEPALRRLRGGHCPSGAEWG